MESRRGRASRIFETIEGMRLSLKQWSKHTGLSYDTLHSRYADGDRGLDLIRPSNTRARNHYEREDLREMAERKRAAKQQAEEAKREHLASVARSRAKIAAEHAAAFAKPLIDAKLLTKAERKEIARKVKGVQRWNQQWFGESRDSRESGR